mmetsp:Transcript_13053/g.17799  ORF Transcript_13053/g.17799 Transcript_13053/m.17799 type:complete len:486 (+) Transcript_13053:1474-2931(+)
MVSYAGEYHQQSPQQLHRHHRTTPPTSAQLSNADGPYAPHHRKVRVVTYGNTTPVRSSTPTNYIHSAMVTYDVNSTTIPCKNCTGDHLTRECPSTICSMCQAVFPSAAERKQHYIDTHAGRGQPSVRFKLPNTHGSSSKRTSTPRRSDSRTSNQFIQSVAEQYDCTSEGGYCSSAQDSEASEYSSARSGQYSDDGYNQYEVRMQRVVNNIQRESDDTSRPSPPAPVYDNSEEEISSMGKYLVWKGDFRRGQANYYLYGYQWETVSGKWLGSLLSARSQLDNTHLLEERESECIMTYGAPTNNENYDDRDLPTTEVYGSTSNPLMIRVQKSVFASNSSDVPDMIQPEELGIVDTGAQTSTIPENMLTDRMLATRELAPPDTAIKYGNSDVQEVYHQVEIGGIPFYVTPNRCSSALIGVCQITELGHSVSFRDLHMLIEDDDHQYGMRFNKPFDTKEWKMPLSALYQLQTLRKAHPTRQQVVDDRIN